MSFLLACGATIVFERTATTSYVRQMISILKNSCFDRALPSDFEELLKLIHTAQTTGHVSPEHFFSTVEILTEKTFDRQSTHGGLIVLDPLNELSADEIMATFSPSRSGDIGCAVGGRVLLYLSGCHSTTLHLALQHCFNISPSLLFKSYQAAFDDREVLNLLSAAKHFHQTGKVRLEARVKGLWHASAVGTPTMENQNAAQPEIRRPFTPVKASPQEVLS